MSLYIGGIEKSLLRLEDKSGWECGLEVGRARAHRPRCALRVSCLCGRQALCFSTSVYLFHDHLLFFFFFFVFLSFLGPHLRHVEVPRLWVESEL